MAGRKLTIDSKIVNDKIVKHEDEIMGVDKQSISNNLTFFPLNVKISVLTVCFIKYII